MSDDEEQQRLNEKSTLEREIFGGSDDEEDDLDDIENFRLSDEEDEGKHLDDDYGADKRTPKGGKSKGRSQETSPGRDRDSVSPAPSGPPLPKFKKRRGDDIEPGKSKVKKQRRERKRKGGDRLEDRDEAPPRELSPESQKMEEAKRDFEEALKKIKPRRVKKGDLPDEAEIDEMMARILAKMKEAADNDQELNQQKQPAIAKLKLLPSVVEQLSKPQLMEQFLENHILEGIKFWLEPLKGDASLPSLDIQRAMFRALLEMPIRTEHLRESGIGRVVKFYEICDRVVPEIKKIVRQLMDRWMRPIMNKSSNYRDRMIREVDYDPVEASASYSNSYDDEGPVERRGGKGAAAEPKRARIPLPIQPAFDIVPRSNIPSHMLEKNKGTSDKYKKLKARMQNLKRSGVRKSGAKISIEGRGLK